jgi:hypothetical protein
VAMEDVGGQQDVGFFVGERGPVANVVGQGARKPYSAGSSGARAPLISLPRGRASVAGSSASPGRCCSSRQRASSSVPDRKGSPGPQAPQHATGPSGLPGRRPGPATDGGPGRREREHLAAAPPLPSAR